MSKQWLNKGCRAALGHSCWGARGEAGLACPGLPQRTLSLGVGSGLLPSYFLPKGPQ